MKISDIIDKSSIVLNLRASDRDGSLKEITDHLLRTGKIPDIQPVLQALLKREETESTAVGDGIAFPHARIDSISEPVVLIAVSRKGLDFHATDAHPVHLLFMFLTPVEKTEMHLQILAKSAALLSDKGFYHKLRHAKTPAAALSLMLHHEKGGRETFMPLSTEQIFEELETGQTGLSPAEAEKRLGRYGLNVIQEVRGVSLLRRFTDNLTNLFALLLWAGGFLSFLASMPELGWAIFAVIIINAFFSFWQEYRAEKALAALGRLLPRKNRVIRDGKEMEIPADNTVPGDIILIEEGDRISADARLIEAYDMRVDNSTLTGESKPVYKTSDAVANGKEFLWTELPNLLFAGATVTSGTGKAAVIATGMHTEIGRIASLSQELSDIKSPLQQEIEKVTKIVTFIAVAMGLTFFFLGTMVGNLSLEASFIFTIGIIVANVPEGLMPTVSLSLAMAVQRMARRNALIKRLSSVETLGCATVICTDKTGTLTTGEMTVTKLWVDGKNIDVSGNSYEPTGGIYLKGIGLTKTETRAAGLDPLFDCCVLCNNAALIPPEDNKGRWNIVGDPTEAALLTLAAKGGIDIEGRRKAVTRIGQLPFEAVRKRMTAIHLIDGTRVAYVKGAPGETLPLCSSIFVKGKIEMMTDEMRTSVMTANDALASEGLRILAMAYRPMDTSDGFTIDNTEKDLIFIGLVGMMDPPRSEVSKAISLCHRAGIRIMMLTGDYGLTAIAVARKIGLIKTDSPELVTGFEVSAMDDNALKSILKDKEVVFARVSPEHKMRIVSALQELGEIVAVTGDGVNDGPALKKADIGVAMGIRGSDVAKESADIVLTDDNFASIVAAIEEGRAVYANIRKFVTYIFTSNIPEIIPFISFILFKIPLPLTVMQILAVDLGTDMIPALGLGTEPPEPGAMDKPPRKRDKRLLDLPLILRAYCFLGPLEAIACMSGFFFVYVQSGWLPGMEMPDSGDVYIKATTMSLAGIVTAQIGNVLACRTEGESVFRAGILKNRLVLWGIAFELILISLLIYTPYLNNIFGLSPIGWNEWALLMVFPAALLFLEESRKWFMRRYSGNSG